MTIPRQLLAPRYWPTWCGVAVMWFLAQLPRAVNHALGRGMGTLFYYFARQRRRIAWVNLEMCFPEKSEAERQRLLKRTMQDQGIGLMETVRAWFRPIEDLDIVPELHGEEHLSNDDGQGIIVIGTHFTGLDVGGALLAQSFPADSFYRRHKNPVLERILSRARGRYGEPIHRRDVKRALKRLREGRRLFYLPDQDYGRKSAAFVPFFGVLAATTIATSTLAKAGRARVVMTHQQRLDNGRRYRIDIVPLPQIPSDDPAADARAINAQLEDNIRKVPEQYMWVHRRFKTRPEGKATFY
ncbi:LpxL/LpxP family Kdo(2)-lipid IV(A) lauroyl/palmitoleoyl acyltransferase [Spongiibacter nanhainus]|uniref:LpxL/LpxP family Kdo(2)-lipid IV(A) lauroyl/palmitoleoyl acyltransferase n=1 Tax=Spongiibacter nanhainus TaxID=2794344 RepID=A0A7T4QZA3_9GAMM|nr:LpxL/LpxP family Kdo(2)-lipid IV(A) lauroyl/palmitoleoyl acyltransferase [Spongiibacter nanhainus]QQD17491.1 LpxL/LpxP family Kdo(2)-lipid IV(A) lauroyl/palmitoleoyl acyltransferase [Spongiibacter nanhainus]